MDPQCIFCQIVTGQVPAFKVYEDQFVIAYQDKYPRTKGTMNVIAKRHITYLYELNGGEFQGLFVAIAKVMSAIKATYANCNGFMVLSNEGPGSGAQVQHLFFQLIPRYGSPEKDTASIQGYSQENPDPFLKSVFDELSTVLSIAMQVATQAAEVKKEQNNTIPHQPKPQEQQKKELISPQILAPMFQTAEQKQQPFTKSQTTIPSEHIDTSLCDVASISSLEKEINALNSKLKNLKNSCGWE